MLQADPCKILCANQKTRPHTVGEHSEQLIITPKFKLLSKFLMRPVRLICNGYQQGRTIFLYNSLRLQRTRTSSSDTFVAVDGESDGLGQD